MIEVLKEFEKHKNFFKVEYFSNGIHGFVVCLRQTDESIIDWRKKVIKLFERWKEKSNNKFWLNIKFYNSDDYIIIV
jgi:histidinol phosphatase-like enzyme